MWIYPRRTPWISILIATASYACAQSEIKPAPQIGPSCAFFGNIPALTLETGVDISSATEFIRPIYGLHRGDFHFRSSFDKHKFFELFSIPYVRTELKHPALTRDELSLRMQEIISTRIDPALDAGRIFSLRSVGAFGGPHNTLLLDRNDGKYRIHDPYPGTIRFLDRSALAEIMLVRSTASKNQAQARYVTHFLELRRSDKQWTEALTPAKLPATLDVTISETERKHIARAFRLNDPPLADPSLASRIAHFKELDFAALPPRKGEKKPVNVTSENLDPKELLGLIRVAQFTLCVWDLRHRDLLPVLFIDGRPQILSLYQKDPNEGIFLRFDDGKNTVTYPLLNALERIKIDGSMYATFSIPRLAIEH